MTFFDKLEKRNFICRTKNLSAIILRLMNSHSQKKNPGSQFFFSRVGIIFLKIDLMANSLRRDHPRMRPPESELRHKLCFSCVQFLLSFGYFHSQIRVWENKPEVIILIRSYGYKGVV